MTSAECSSDVPSSSRRRGRSTVRHSHDAGAQGHPGGHQGGTTVGRGQPGVHGRVRCGRVLALAADDGTVPRDVPVRAAARRGGGCSPDPRPVRAVVASVRRLATGVHRPGRAGATGLARPGAVGDAIHRRHDALEAQRRGGRVHQKSARSGQAHPHWARELVATVRPLQGDGGK